MADESAYQIIRPNEVPVDPKGLCIIDLYLYLPTADRYVRYVCAGDILTDEKRAAVNRHPIPNLFVLGSELADARSGLIGTPGQASALPETFKVDVVGTEAKQELKMVFKAFIDPTSDPMMLLKSIENKADAILDVVAPETKKLKEHLISHLKHVSLMNDVAALTSIAILIAAAAGFDSKKSYRDIAYAVLVMDASLTEFTDEELDQYYRDRTQLPADILQKILKHPLRSHELVETKLKSLSDVTKQLILSHHELFNGKGYPRGTRSEALFPMVKTLAFAVDLFEVIKRGQLNNNPISLAQALLDLRELEVEAHLHRHSKKLVDTVMKYLEMDSSLAMEAQRIIT